MNAVFVIFAKTSFFEPDDIKFDRSKRSFENQMTYIYTEKNKLQIFSASFLFLLISYWDERIPRILAK